MTANDNPGCSPAASLTPHLAISLLGGFQVSYDGTPLPPPTSRRLITLIAVLSMEPGLAYPRHHLAFMLWPDSSERQAYTNLRHLLYRLRATLPNADRFVQADRGTIRWVAGAPYHLDVVCFEAALEQAAAAQQRGDVARQRRALEQAVRLYGGEFLPGCYEEWATPYRERLRHAVCRALEELTALLEAAGDYRGARSYAERLLQMDPLDETAYCRLIQLCWFNGDRAHAIRVYQTCSSILARELGAPPSPATCALYEQILGAGQPATVLPAMDPAAPGWPMLQAAWEQALDADTKRSLPGTAPSPLAAGVGESLGDVLVLTGNYVEAAFAYEAALDAAEVEDCLRRARLQRKLANTLRDRQRFDEALRMSRLAERTLSQPLEVAAASWWHEWIEIHIDRLWVHYWLGQVGAMTRLAERTRPIVERSGGAAQRAKYYQGLLAVMYRRDRYAVTDEAVGYARQMLAAVQEAGQVNEVPFALFGVGGALLWRRELEEAEVLLNAALHQAEGNGDTTLCARCLTYLTIVSRFRGQVGPTEQMAQRSLEVARRAGMIEYIAMAESNMAWVALRRGELLEAQRLGEHALDLWQTLAPGHPIHSFAWAARWPLLSIVRQHEHLDEAMAGARILLAPPHQRLPDTVAIPLERAVEAADAGQPTTARAALDIAIEQAGKQGYL